MVRDWGTALAGTPEHSPRTIVVGDGVEIVRGSSPRLPRSDKQEEPKCIFGPSVLTPTSYASCSIRIGAYARGVLSFDLEALDRWYEVNERKRVLTCSGLSFSETIYGLLDPLDRLVELVNFSGVGEADEPLCAKPRTVGRDHSSLLHQVFCKFQRGYF